MRKKKAKYGIDPILDNRKPNQKMAWESTYSTPIVANPDGQYYPKNVDASTVSPDSIDTNLNNVQTPDLTGLRSGLTLDQKQIQGTGLYDLHPLFKGVNTLALATTGIAQAINEGKNSRAERLKYLSALQNRFVENNPVLNEQTAYMKDGGEARKVDKVPDGYTFSHADGNRKFFNKKNASGTLAMASASKNQGGADYETFLQQQLANGISPDELVAKKYISPDKIDNYSQYYKPTVDNVFIEDTNVPQSIQSNPNPQEAFMGDIIMDTRRRAVGRLRNRSRNLSTGAGTNDTGLESADFMYIQPDVKGAPVDTKRGVFNLNTKQLQDIFGTGRIMTKDVEEYMKNSHVAKMPYGGGPLTAEGAKEMLRDGKARGKKLTAKQKRYFGYIAGGGKPKAKYGLPPELADQATVEAEAGETYTTQDGDINLIPDSAPTHEEGGVLLNNVDRVLEDTSTSRKDIISKALKVTPDKFQAMFGFKSKKPLSHSKALEKASNYFTKKSDKVKRGIEDATDILLKNKNDVYANNSLDLNLKTIKSIPTDGDVFNVLFEHQENVKDMLGVKEQKAKYGKYVPQARAGYEDITPYLGGKTKKGATTPTGKFNAFDKDKNEYKKIWKQLGLDPDSMSNAEFQSKAYDYILENHPDVARSMWKEYGNTAKGIKEGVGKGYDFGNLDDSQLKKLKSAYVDGLVGVRTLQASLPPKIPAMPYQEDPNWTPPEEAKPTPVTPTTTPAAPVSNPGFKLRDSGSPSRFNEPLRWYDTAGPLMNLMSSDRIPAQYNPIELNEVKLKQQNPTAALEAGNRDYNAALSVLPDSGAGMANATNAFSSKYAIGNQILGQYENTNAGIKNQETMYNANVRDKQSFADQQSRGVFEQQMLAGKEAQRQQKLRAFDDLFTRVALNRKLNREGNLIMQLAPNFNQRGQYNGNQRYFTPTFNGATSDHTGEGITYITDPRTGQQLPVLRENGKLQNKSKILAGLPK